MAALRQRHGTLAAVKGHKPREALVTQMPKVSFARVARRFARVAEIALGDHPKRADGRQRSAVVAVQLIPMIAVDHDLAFESARQFQTLEKDIAWVAVARIPVSFANVLVAVPRVVVTKIKTPFAPEFDPVDVQNARI